MSKHVLIDNDLLIHKSWEFAAKKAGEQLSCFFSVDSFIEAKSDFHVESTIIYIDSDLDDGLRGEIEAQKLFELGYNQLFMASGKNFEEGELPDYIKGCVSKRSPF